MPRSSRTILLVLIAATVLAQAAVQAARPLTSYRTLAVDGSALWVGVNSAVFALLSVMAAIPLGRLLDRTGRCAESITIGALGCAASCLALGYAPSVWLVMVASALLGCAHLLLMAGSQSLVAQISRDSETDRNFGWLAAAVSGGQLIGPLVLGLLLGDDAGLSATSRAGIAPSLLALASVPLLLLLVRLTREVRRTRPVRGADEPAVSLVELWRRPGIPVALIVSGTLLTAVDLITAYLPLLAHERGIAPATVGVLLSVRALASIASRSVLSSLTRWFDRRHLVAASGLGSGAAILLATLPMPVLLLGVVLAISGLLLGLGQPLTMTQVVRAVPANSRSTALSLRLISNRTSQLVIPALAGVVTASTGGVAAFALTGLLLIGVGGLAARPGK